MFPSEEFAEVVLLLVVVVISVAFCLPLVLVTVVVVLLIFFGEFVEFTSLSSNFKTVMVDGPSITVSLVLLVLDFLTKLGFALVVVLVVVDFSFVVSDELLESFFNFEFTSSFKSSRSYTELSSFILSHDLKSAVAIRLGYWDIRIFGSSDIGTLGYLLTLGLSKSSSFVSSDSF